MKSHDKSDWDFYFSTVDGVPSSILVDLTAIQRAPVGGKPWLLWVRVHLRSQRENGFPADEEAPRLYALEDCIDENLSAITDAEPTGRVTGGQRRECYYYSSGPGHLEQAVARVRESFPEYTIECGARRDPEWSHYREFLFPSDQDMRRIHTRRVVFQLEEHGDDHSIRRPVDHTLHFRTAEDRRRFADLAGRGGFKVRLESKGSGERPFLLNLQRDDPVTEEHIDQVVEELAERAEGCDGDYDGWGCPICRGETPTS